MFLNIDDVNWLTKLALVLVSKYKREQHLPICKTVWASQLGKQAAVSTLLSTWNDVQSLLSTLRDIGSGEVELSHCSIPSPDPKISSYK